jgi:hypothetical protein
MVAECALDLRAASLLVALQRLRLITYCALPRVCGALQAFFATIALIGCRHWPLFHHRMLASFLAPFISLATSPPLHCVWGVAFGQGVSFGGANSLRCLAPLHPVSRLHVSGSLFSEVVGGVFRIFFDLDSAHCCRALAHSF